MFLDLTQEQKVRVQEQINRGTIYGFAAGMFVASMFFWLMVVTAEDRRREAYDGLRERTEH